MWELSNTGADARETFPVADRRGLREEFKSREQQTLLANSLVSLDNMYTVSSHLLRDDVSDTFPRFKDMNSPDWMLCKCSKRRY